MDLAQHYEAYSLEDLRDVERHLNRARFPERYAALVEEIARREGGTLPVLEAPPKPEPPWHAKVRRAYWAWFAAHVMACCVGVAVHIWDYNHGLPRPSGTHTERMQGAKSSSRTVYVTQSTKARDDWFSRVQIPGILITLALGALLQHSGIRIGNPRPKQAC